MRYWKVKCVFLNWLSARNECADEDPIKQIQNVQGPRTKSLKGFKESLNIYKWCDPRFMTSDGPSDGS
jgi:hypothetical protein